MARQYPRFLYSNPQNTKSKGPFIIHLLEPRLICRLVDNNKEDVRKLDHYFKGVSGWYIELLEVFDTNYNALDIDDIMHDMLQWASRQKEITEDYKPG